MVAHHNARVRIDAMVVALEDFILERANKAEGGGTTLHQLIAKLLTGQNLFPGTRMNLIVNQLVA